VQLSPDSSGKKMDTRTEGTNSEHRQVMVLGDPATNAGVAPVDATKGLAVDLTATGANTTALKVDGSAVTQPVSGTVTANAGSGTMAVSAASLPLPSGASTAAKQPALGTAGTASADVITVQGITSMTALKTDGSGVTQPVSGTVTANIGTAGSLALDATLTGGTAKAIATDGTNSVSVSTAGADGTSNTFNGLRTSAHAKVFNGTTWDRFYSAGGANNTSGTGVSASGSMAIARTSDIASNTNGNYASLVADKAGKLVALPYALPELFISNWGSATGTSAVSVISAQGAGIKIYITAISVVNTGTAGSLVTIQIDPAGTPTTLWQMVNPSGGGSNITFPNPLVVTANKAVGFTAATASTTQYVSISGYTGA